MSRRSWSQKEEEILLVAVKDLVVRGWKSDNGFRGGHLILHLEDAMKEFPHTDIKGTPHIKSKLGSWKNYGSLTGISSQSGIGWNLNGNFTIDCDDHQWDQIVKMICSTIILLLDGNARTMRFKSEMSRAAIDRLEMLVSRIGVEFDVRKAKQEAYAKLCSIPSLSMEDKFNVCIIMAVKVELLEIFIGLSEEARPNYMAHLLKN